MQRRTRATTFGALTTAVLTGLAALPALSAPALADSHGPDSTVFINEIHYDNAGTDTGEAIEVAGPAGTDLSGWSLVLYNGSGGGPYSTVELAGSLGDQQGGLGTTWVDYASNGIQNGSPDGVALVNAAGEAVQFLSYEGTFTAESGPAEGLDSTDIGVIEGSSTALGQSLQLTGSGSTYDDFTWASGASTFGTVNQDQAFGDGTPGTEPEPRPQPDACDVPVTHEIGAIQGTGDTTPLADTRVTVEGVVVGDFQARGQLGGFFLQDGDGDGDRRTSDGVFVYAPSAADVAVGDVVRVTGRAGEYPSGDGPSSTQISARNLVATCGTAPVPKPTTLALPASDEERERLEHMLVTVPQRTVATENYTLGRYGELWVSLGQRLYQPTNDPGNDVENQREQERNDRSRLLIDDGSSWQNPWDVPFTDDQGPIRLGDTVGPVTGVLDYAHDAYRIQPTEPTSFIRTNPRTTAPEEVGGDLQVASFNVLNYFTTLDTGSSARTDAGVRPRGAEDAEEFERQQAKIVAAILELDADVVGLMEIENDSDDEAVDNLVAALNTAAGEVRYAAVEEPNTTEAAGQPDGLFGTDAIKVAMIYQPATVSPAGAAHTLEDDAFYNARLPLVQTFEPVAGGDPVTVAVNHFKSKSCYDDASGGNLDAGDGQGCYNADRVAQATALAAFLDGLDMSDVAIIGDLNAYGEEDPIHVLEDAGYVDMIDRRIPAKDQYTYVFRGQAGYLDHALVSRSLARRVTGVDLWHINSDEATALDYNDYNQDHLYSADPYKSSDHDPVLLGLRSSGPGGGPRR